jgi:hypothetical protein
MGSSVNAECDCGYHEEDLLIGGGMMNFMSFCGFPVYCKSCQSLEVLAYDDQSLSKGKGKNVVADWNMIERLGRKLVLTDGKYFCPSCQKFGLSFRESDVLWD